MSTSSVISNNSKSTKEFSENDENGCKTTMGKGAKQIIMEIEVKFGKGRCDQVTVHFGDDPTDLAKVIFFNWIYYIIITTVAICSSPWSQVYISSNNFSIS